MNNYKTIKNFVIYLSLLLLFPVVVSAATVFTETSSQTFGVNNTFMAKVYLNTEGKTVNVVEGSVEVYGKDTQVLEVSLGGSSLSLWPNPPIIKKSDQSTSITFTGGVPGGFSSAKGLLFTLAIKTISEGQLKIESKNIVAYENDGKGTQIKVASEPIVVSVIENKLAPNNEWSELVATDKVPPENFVITFGQDASVYEGKKFISFETTDALSGIDYFEVKEGGSSPVKTGSPYVLQDQSGKSKIQVIAYDKAGNYKISTWNPPVTPKNNLILVLVSLVIIISAIIFVIKIFLKKTKIKNS